MKPGTGVALTRKVPNGSKVNFIVLTPEQARQAWGLELAGRERLLLSPNVVLPETTTQITLETFAPESAALAVFPPVTDAAAAGRPLKTKRDGVFQSFSLPGPAARPLSIECEPVRSAPASAKDCNAMDESAWSNAAVWRIRLPQDVASSTSLLRIRYIGDVARVYAGGRLLVDHFYNGQPFDVALWRLGSSELASLELHLLPWQTSVPPNIAAQARPKLDGTTPAASLLTAEGLSRTRLTVSFLGGGR